MITPSILPFTIGPGRTRDTLKSTPRSRPIPAIACVVARARTTPASGSTIAMVLSSALITGQRLRTSSPEITSCFTPSRAHCSRVNLRNGSSAARMMTSPVV